MFVSQGSLFGTAELEIDRHFTRLARRELADGAWVDYAPGWLAGDESLLELIAERAHWSSPEINMYDKVVKTPRAVASVDTSWHPLLGEMVDVLSARYEKHLGRVSAGFYRDGRDSVAWHGDRVARGRDEAVVATVSLGGPRRFLLRPAAGGASMSYSLGQGDLIVMGGSCQRTWRHAVPKVASAPPRIALMFRHEYD